MKRIVLAVSLLNAVAIFGQGSQPPNILGYGAAGVLASGSFLGAVASTPPGNTVYGLNTQAVSPGYAPYTSFPLPTYISGIVATGAAGTTCLITSTGSTANAVGQVTLSATNTVAGGSVITYVGSGLSVGNGFTVAPTTGTVSSGTATCSGTATISTALGAYVPLSSSGGITQLTGDVTAGPGSGSLAATVVGLKGVSLGAFPGSGTACLLYTFSTNALTWSTSCPGSGGGTINSGPQWSPTFYATAGTTVSGTTPFTGFEYWPGSGAPQAAVAANVATLLGSLTGCSTANYFYSPASGNCQVGASSSFPSLTGGTNTTAAMVVGSGSSLGASGSGTIVSTSLSGGALGSLPYQSGSSATTMITSPTTSGHTFVLAWQPSGSATAPAALDLAAPPTIGATTPAIGYFSKVYFDTAQTTSISFSSAYNVSTGGTWIFNGTLRTVTPQFASIGTAIASASTIAPTTPIVHVTGTTAIATITAPCTTTGIGCQVTLIPDGIWTTTTAGNIAIASTAVVSKAEIFTYDPGTSKWYPSY